MGRGGLRLASRLSCAGSAAGGRFATVAEWPGLGQQAVNWMDAHHNDQRLRRFSRFYLSSAACAKACNPLARGFDERESGVPAPVDAVKPLSRKPL